MNAQHEPQREIYRAVKEDQPNVVTDEGFIGLFSGLLIGLTAPLMGLTAPYVTPLIGALFGAGTGGLAGYLRTRGEYTNGRYVGKPSLFNLKLLAGAMFGGVVMAALAPTAPFLAIIGVVGACAGIGSVAGYAEQKEEFEAAKQKHTSDQLVAQNQSREQESIAREPAAGANLPELENTHFRAHVEKSRIPAPAKTR